MPRVLALDPSTHTGFAVMEWGRSPLFGSWYAPAEPVGFYARRFSTFFHWLGEMRQVHQFDALGYEAPIMRETDNIHELRLLIGFADIIEMFAGIHGIPCREVSVQTVKLALTGDPYAKKKAMVSAACRLGWKVANDDQADAGSVGMVVIEDLSLTDPSWKTPQSARQAAA
jgi:Holliday junction resolvasome RuvABC endonuclease subunit